MSSSRSIIESLSSLGCSANYSSTIKLYTEMNHLSEFRGQFESISSIIEIPPPNVWFSIDENKCLIPIRNDTERSRENREGILYTNMKGHLMNRIKYDIEEDIGTFQDTEQSFCVSFAVVKDTCEEYIKKIDSELKLCLLPTRNLIDQSHLKVSQLDEISKQIYSKYRIFIIFDCKAQPGKILSIKSCFYPNVRFSIERIKKNDKEGLKFAPNETLNKIQRGEIMNEFGFLSFDSKMRLLMIKKDDPEISKDHWVGVWIVGSFPQKRTKKEFSKEDAIWYSLLEYYTNPEIKSKISIVAKQKGFLCYFGLKKEKQRLDSPEFYFFQPSSKCEPKWAFSTKSEFISEWSKPLEIEIEFQNDTIPEETEMSEISDQPIPNIPPNPRMIKKGSLQENLSGVSANSNQGNNFQIEKMREELEEKDRIIKQLRGDLERSERRANESERRVNELEEINKILKEMRQPQQPIYPFYPYPPHVNPAYYPPMQPMQSIQPIQPIQPNSHFPVSQTPIIAEPYQQVLISSQIKSSLSNEPEPKTEFFPKEEKKAEEKIADVSESEETPKMKESKKKFYEISTENKNGNLSFADDIFQFREEDEPEEEVYENKSNERNCFEDDEEEEKIIPVQNIEKNENKIINTQIQNKLIENKNEEYVVHPESQKVDNSEKDSKKLISYDRSDDSSEEDQDMVDLRKKYLKK